MCTEFNLKIDESTELLDTRIFDNYDTNELLLLSDTIKQSCFEFLFNSHIECCPYCGSVHIVKAGKNSGKTAEEILEKRKADYVLYAKGNTHGGIHGNTYTIPIYGIAKFQFN